MDTNTPEQETKNNLKSLLTQQMFHQSTPPHGVKFRGVGFTRKNKELSKAKLATEKKSRKINRNKKRHHMTAKEKKSR